MCDGSTYLPFFSYPTKLVWSEQFTQIGALRKSAGFNKHLNVLFLNAFWKKKKLVIHLSPIDYEYCAILIYRLKLNNIADHVFE